MKFMHLSDLHLGKRISEFSLIEDQTYILDRIIEITDDEKPDAVLIAGDIYDKPVPSAEAVRLFDDFLCRLSDRKLQAFVISGNHDSSERIAFGARLMNSSGIHMSPVYEGRVEPVRLKDEWGDVYVYMLPYIKPATARRFFPDEKIESYNDAVRVCVKNIDIDDNSRNIIVAHQFVTGALRSDSEDVSVGGSDNVDISIFDAFDYVALGHIHRPQNAGSAKARYCGTPLKYSFSECSHSKSVTIAELIPGKEPQVRIEELVPLHDMREIKGKYMELTDRSCYEGTAVDDYLHITLTDEEEIPDAIGKLRAVYPNIMKLDYDNKRTRSNSTVDAAEAVESRSPMELFEELYQLQNNSAMSDEQRNFCLEIIKQIWEDER
ncbi:MAG: exonuclease SbcCD subunit D [Bacillota bacterium]|nr:exonuclease SbcCD subunit D [Bacillota bacterium]